MQQVSVSWAPLPYSTTLHIAQATVDFGIDTDATISFGNMLYGSYRVKPSYATIDNLNNPSAITLTDNGVPFTVPPYTRLTKPLSDQANKVSLSASYGKCNIVISEMPWADDAQNNSALFGNVYPVMENFSTKSIAAALSGSSNAVTLKKGDVILFTVQVATGGNICSPSWNVSVDQTLLDAVIPDNIIFNTGITWTTAQLQTQKIYGINNALSRYHLIAYPGTTPNGIDIYGQMAGAANSVNVYWARANADCTVILDCTLQIAAAFTISSMRIVNCGSLNTDIIDSARGGVLNNMTAQNQKSYALFYADITAIVAGTTYLLPNANLSNRNRYAIMVLDHSAVGAITTVPKIGTSAITKQNDLNGVSISGDNFANAGSTGPSSFVSSAAAAVNIKWALIFIKRNE